MIIGTAGHIDHGKTTLVRALTGVDTDRLPEEKKRGISIELGYAFLDLPGVAERLGFIDVPGHERLVHTMLAGATGIDAALLLVAADDGPMPQTREHLAVLSLLGLERGVVALTKVDRVDDARRMAVRAEVQAMLAGTPLAGAPVLEVAATTGLGLPALRDALAALARDHRRERDADQGFRLAIDRAFTLDGTGLVVTGTVHAGRVRAGDELALLGADGRRARVRSLHAQNRPVDEAVAGQRCAVALAGLARDDVSRGGWLVHPALARPTDRLDVDLWVWPGEPRALRSGTPVHLHLGAAQVQASVAVLQCDGSHRDALAPGERGRVQLVLRTPVGAWHGDRLVLRDASASRTLAGGRVLDPDGPARYRRTPQRQAELDALEAATPAERLQRLLAVAPHGLDLAAWAAAQGLPEVSTLLPGLPEGTLQGVQRPVHAVLGPAQAQAARDTVLQALDRYHAQQPDELGPDAGRLRRLACPRLPEALWHGLLGDLRARGSVQLRGAFVHRPDHAQRLSAVEQRIAQKVAPQLAVVGAQGAWARDLAIDCGEPEPLMRVTLARLAQRGEVHQVVKDLYVAPDVLARLVVVARDTAHAADGSSVTAAAFRDRTGLGRKRAIQLLEYLDRIGVLRRVGDEHKLRRDSPLLADARP